jgi:hypothetical protein
MLRWFRELGLACARLEGEGGPSRAAACFETHRSEGLLAAHYVRAALRCSSA